MPMPNHGVFRNCSQPTSLSSIRNSVEASTSPSPVNHDTMPMNLFAAPSNNAVFDNANKMATNSTKNPKNFKNGARLFFWDLIYFRKYRNKTPKPTMTRLFLLSDLKTKTTAIKTNTNINHEAFLKKKKKKLITTTVAASIDRVLILLNVLPNRPSSSPATATLATP